MYFQIKPYLNFSELAALDKRNNQFNADEYLYVVDQSQYSHFTHLKSIFRALGNSELAEKIIHVKYGRVIGLSTRYLLYSRFV